MTNMERLYSKSLDQYNDLEDLVLNSNVPDDVYKILERLLERHLDCLECMENELDGEGKCTFG